MQLFVAMNGCAGMGGGGWAGCLQTVHADRTTLHTMPDGVGGCLGGGGWAGSPQRRACSKYLGPTYNACGVGGLVGRGWVGGMSQRITAHNSSRKGGPRECAWAHLPQFATTERSSCGCPHHTVVKLMQSARHVWLVPSADTHVGIPLGQAE